MNSDQGNVNLTRAPVPLAIRCALLGLIAALPLDAQEMKSDEPFQPVIVGTGPTEDACGAIGSVSGLNSEGSNVLSVRVGPDTSYRRVDLVPTAQLLFICGQKGQWYAVVYAKDAKECGVSTPIDPPVPYSGACKSGWVYSDFVKLIAG
ncbi:SH3 domain-containing protein [Sedimentitalea todarodis]|uniref:Integron n=1 Tax=Sedimentitalea todarodis TaxID=1631240 RepID=A0ABU3VKW3_9RHOB|nr:hypothetical protein [Sedimentitalea todarodis]MDU9006829.1 hypothetical protein [Sedimentitalea todarodis]